MWYFTRVQHLTIFLNWQITVADPGFPRGGCANCKGGGANCKPIIFANFPQKLHEIEEIWSGGGASLAPPPPLDPPMNYTTEQSFIYFFVRLKCLFQFFVKQNLPDSARNFYWCLNTFFFNTEVFIRSINIATIFMTKFDLIFSERDHLMQILADFILFACDMDSCLWWLDKTYKFIYWPWFFFS